MRRTLGTVLLASIFTIALPPAVRAAEFTVWSQEVRVTGDAPGVLIVILNFWDRPVEVAFRRLWQGQWTYVVRYRESFKVLVYDLTAEELRDLELDARLRALEEDVASIRGNVAVMEQKVQLICERFRRLVPGCG